jgi:anti-sigma regulatory factor (Ser/Thr protein kinase)
MPIGSMLVLYTDGLTEATKDPIAGEELVRESLSDEEVRTAPNVALAIHDAVIEGVSRDDVAVLTVEHVERNDAAERLTHWSFDARDPDAARDVRKEFLDHLRRGDMGPEGLSNAELVFSELVGNVVRYAPRWVDITLDWSGSAPVLHVLDGGPGFQHIPRLPDNVLSERGRGLFIVARLTHEFHVTKRPHGGSHARAVLLRANEDAPVVRPRRVVAQAR